MMILLLCGCSRDQISLHFQKLPSGHVFIFELKDHPGLASLRRSENLENISKGRTRGLQQLEALVQWASKLFPLGSPYPEYPPWDAESILREIRAGRTGGFCAQYAVVFGQSCQSIGYEVRYFDIAESHFGRSHFIAEIFVPSHNKWVAFDPQHGFWYGTFEGEPLSVLELHTLLEDKAGKEEKREKEEKDGKEVYKHPEKLPLASKQLILFKHFRMYLRNNYLTLPVRVAYKNTEKGIQMLFENYRMHWWDDSPENKRVAPRGATSSRPEDFNFIPSDSLAGKVSTPSLSDLEKALAQLSEGSAQIFTMPRRVAEAYLQDVLIKDDRFHPLGANR